MGSGKRRNPNLRGVMEQRFCLNGNLAPILWINGPLFYAAGIMGIPYGLAGSEGAYGQLVKNFNHGILILVSHAALFLLPSVWGLRYGIRAEPLRMSGLLRMLAAIAIPIGILTVSAGWTPDARLDRLSAYAVLNLPAVFICVRTLRRERSPAR